MGQLDNCYICGKKTKFMFICPHCTNIFCFDHRKQEHHNCEQTVKEKLNTIENEQFDLIEVPNDVFEPENDLNLVEFKEEKINIFEQERLDIPKVPLPIADPNHSIKLIKDNQEEKNINLNENRSNKISELNKPDKIKAKKTIKKINSDNLNLKHIGKLPKLIVISILLLFTISYFVMNGFLFSIMDLFNKPQSDDYNILFEKYSLIEDRYNELYSDYIKLEREYELIKDSYSELEDEYEISGEFDSEIILEQMKQVTIPPDSNAVFFYEIPAPGYITVEYYSDLEIYSMVGSTLFANVYYSRNPQVARSSEFIFSVPVTPDINIFFSNSDRDKSATVFFRIVYYYKIDQ